MLNTTLSLMTAILCFQANLFANSNNKMQCKIDNDCELVVPQGCCSCEEGGGRIPVLKGSSISSKEISCEDILSMPEGQCSMKPSTLRSCSPQAQPKCYFGHCFFELPEVVSEPVSLPNKSIPEASKNTNYVP